MAHPYFSFSAVVEDVPRINDETDKDLINRIGGDSDYEIDNELPSPTFTTPLVTVPTVITIASNKRVKGKYFINIGELARGNALIADSKADVQNYIASVRTTTTDTFGTVNIQDGTFNDFKNSPLLDGEFTD